jgi:hypothetical protein
MRYFSPIALSFASLLLASCESDPPPQALNDTSRGLAHNASATKADVAIYEAVEFPMPPETEINRDDTNVVGNRAQWFGTLALSSRSSVDDVQEYYGSTLPGKGWEPISSLIGNRVILQFVNKRIGRACIVIIEPRSILKGAEIQIIVAPLV